MSQTEPVVLVEKDNGVAVVTLNRPNAMNALSTELRALLAQTFEDLEADPETRVVILTGAGERAFTAGLDLKELGQDGMGTQGTITNKDPVTSINQFSGPVIGAINGVAITGGFEVALACDVIIASDNARFADTHARVGILPGWGLSQKLSRTIGIYRAKQLSFTGNFLSAQQAADWGLVGQVVPQAELLATCKKLAQDMLTVVPESLNAYKALIDEGYAQAYGDGLKTEQKVSASANSAVSADAIENRREGIRERGKAQTS